MKLYPYQERAVAHVLKNKRCALWLECGLGKTATTLTALQQLPKPAIVLAPKRVADHVWEQEARLWWPEAKVVQIKGTPAKRLKLLQEDADLFVINFELITWLVGVTPWVWPTVVIDEATKVKNQSSKLFKALKKVAPKWQRLIELTGSPSPNGLIDLWSQVYLLDGGKRLGKGITAFRDRWFDSDYMGWTYTPKAHAQKEIESRCADICLSMQAEDYLDVPDRIIADVVVDLPPKAVKVYDDMRKHMVSDLENGDTITAMTAGVMAAKLLQITSGMAYSDEGKVRLHDAKLDALDDVLATTGGEPVVVVYQFKHELERLRERYPHGVELRDGEDVVERWNAGAIALLFLQTASAAHGLNLQHGGRYMAWLTLTYNLEHYQQTNARLHRTGQTKPVTIYRILASGTADEKVVGVLEGKGSLQDQLMKALK